MAALPLAARAQRAEPMRRIGVLIEFDETDPEAKAYPSGLTRGLAQLGWTDGRNVRIDIRWAAGSVERMKMLAKELVKPATGCDCHKLYPSDRFGKT